MTEPTTMTKAAVALLLFARAEYTGEPFDEAAIENFIHPRMRYSHRGPDSRLVTPDQAWDELVAAGRVTGTRGAWAPAPEAEGGDPS